MAKAEAAHPFRHKLFLLVVRNRLANELVAQEGYTRADAREAVAGLDDGSIEQAATAVNGAQAMVGAGGFLEFLIQFLNSPAFAQLLQILLSLFSAKAGTVTLPAAPAPA